MARRTHPSTSPTWTAPSAPRCVLLLLGEKHGQPIWAMLEEDEVKKISYAMAQLGSIEPKTVERLIVEFISRLSSGGAVTGSLDRTEELLAKIFPGEQVTSIMSDIKGASGRRMWQRLSHIEPEILANYLRSEYPQTVAVILSRLRPDHTARVLSILPDDFSVDVVNRMLRMETVQKEALEYIEETLRNEFVDHDHADEPARRARAHGRGLQCLRPSDRGALPRVARRDQPRRGAQDPRPDVHLRGPDEARSGQRPDADPPRRQGDAWARPERARTRRRGHSSSPTCRRARRRTFRTRWPRWDRSVSRMSTSAQTKMVNLAKELAEKGEIMISKNRAEEELVY